MERNPTSESARRLAGTAGGTERTQSTPYLIDAKDARALLAIGARKLWSLTNCGAIPSHRIGRSVRYSPVELRAWIDAGCPTDAGAGDRIRKAVRP